MTRDDVLARHGLPSATPLFIRFGEPPQNERSGIGASPNIYKLARSAAEVGVSVYGLEFCDDGLLALADFSNVSSAAELLNLFERGRRKGFIVTGRQLRYEDLTRAEKRVCEWTHSGFVYGIDSETLLRDVRILEAIEPYTVRGHGFHEPDRSDVEMWADMDAIEREAAEAASAGLTP